MSGFLTTSPIEIQQTESDTINSRFDPTTFTLFIVVGGNLG